MNCAGIPEGTAVSGDAGRSGVSGRIAGLDESAAGAFCTDRDDDAGFEESRCGSAAGDFTPLVVGRLGRATWGVGVVERIEISAATFCEDTCLVAGCMVRVGGGDSGGEDRRGSGVFSPVAGVDSGASCLSDVEDATDANIEV
jgi:hypothetical protein